MFAKFTLFFQTIHRINVLEDITQSTSRLDTILEKYHGSCSGGLICIEIIGQEDPFVSPETRRQHYYMMIRSSINVVFPPSGSHSVHILSATVNQHQQYL